MSRDTRPFPLFILSNGNTLSAIRLATKRINEPDSLYCAKYVQNRRRNVYY